MVILRKKKKKLKITRCEDINVRGDNEENESPLHSLQSWGRKPNVKQPTFNLTVWLFWIAIVKTEWDEKIENY